MTDWPSSYAMLQARGYLPSSTAYQLDGWGDTFVVDPAGTLPVVRATSSNL